MPKRIVEAHTEPYQPVNLIVTTRADAEHGGSARFDIEARDGSPVASFTVCCNAAAHITEALAAIFPSDWPLELRDAPVPYGDPARH